MQESKQSLYYEVSEAILQCCFEIMNELGSGFLESIYKNALYFALKEKGFNIDVEKRFEVIYRGNKIGLYVADLIVNGNIIIELKCVNVLLGEHQAQLINYLKASDIQVGLLINFGKRRLEYKRLHHPDYIDSCKHLYGK